MTSEEVPPHGHASSCLHTQSFLKEKKPPCGIRGREVTLFPQEQFNMSSSSSTDCLMLQHKCSGYRVMSFWSRAAFKPRRFKSRLLRPQPKTPRASKSVSEELNHPRYGLSFRICNPKLTSPHLLCPCPEAAAVTSTLGKPCGLFQSRVWLLGLKWKAAHQLLTPAPFLSPPSLPTGMDPRPSCKIPSPTSGHVTPGTTTTSCHHRPPKAASERATPLEASKSNPLFPQMRKRRPREGTQRVPSHKDRIETRSSRLPRRGSLAGPRPL